MNPCWALGGLGYLLACWWLASVYVELARASMMALVQMLAWLS